MSKFRNWFSLRRYVFILILLVIFIYLFSNLGNFLVSDDSPDKSDLIIVLMGGGPDRILEAVDLYKQGTCSKILMIENKQPGFDLLVQRGVSMPREAYLWKSVGTQLGVPENAFIILPGDAQSTKDEAKHITAYLKSHDEIRSIILVSSRYHTARAKEIFERCHYSQNYRIKVYSHASRYDDFNEKQWWRSRADAGHLVDEYIRFFSFYTIDRF